MEQQVCNREKLCGWGGESRSDCEGRSHGKTESLGISLPQLAWRLATVLGVNCCLRYQCWATCIWCLLLEIHLWCPTLLCLPTTPLFSSDPTLNFVCQVWTVTVKGNEWCCCTLDWYIGIRFKSACTMIACS